MTSSEKTGGWNASGATPPRATQEFRCANTCDRALAAAAAAGRFGEADVAAILAHRGAQVIEFPARASEQQSLQRSTRSWEGLGR